MSSSQTNNETNTSSLVPLSNGELFPPRELSGSLAMLINRIVVDSENSSNRFLARGRAKERVRACIISINSESMKSSCRNSIWRNVLPPVSCTAAGVFFVLYWICPIFVYFVIIVCLSLIYFLKTAYRSLCVLPANKRTPWQWTLIEPFNDLEEVNKKSTNQTLL